MRRRSTTILIALAVLLAVAIPAGAVMFGEKDVDDEFSYVGLVVFDVGGNPAWRCTGQLLSPTVFLTAGHCTEGTSGARVWFDVDVTSLQYPFAGTDSVEAAEIHTHPLYDDFASFPATHDIGIVILSEAQAGPFTSLAPIGTLDGLRLGTSRASAKFAIAGYGLQDARPTLFSAERSRYKGEVRMIDLDSALNAGFNVQLTSAQGTGGGLCFGDSGGAVYHDGDVVAVNSFVLNLFCMGSGFSHRTDIASVHDWVSSFLD